MNYIEIKRNDILKSIYFITAITQKSGSGSMQGALSSKGDFMGGIFDRWINTVPEAIVFNKIIFPQISSKKIETVTDFYLYDPKIAGIAPDVIGINVDGEIIPFAIFDERWRPIEGMPQIEVKTFKKPQKMISLRNQGYDDKYLVMTESEFRIDYLLPFFNPEIFGEEIHDELAMNDAVFISAGSKDKIQSIDKVSLDNDVIGTVQLLKITTAKSFMDTSTFCEGTVSVQYLASVEEKTRVIGKTMSLPLSDFCVPCGDGLFRFSDAWYDGYTETGIPFYNKASRSGSNRFLYRTLDISSGDIDKITVLKKSVNSIYVKSEVDTYINEHPISANKIYKIEFAMLDRSSNNGEEYFMQKSLIPHIPDFENALTNQLKNIINKEGNENA